MNGMKWQIDCPECDGSGYLADYLRDGRRVIRSCPVCDGEGVIHRDPDEERDRRREQEQDRRDDPPYPE